MGFPNSRDKCLGASGPAVEPAQSSFFSLDFISLSLCHRSCKNRVGCISANVLFLLYLTYQFSLCPFAWILAYEQLAENVFIKSEYKALPTAGFQTKAGWLYEIQSPRNHSAAEWMVLFCDLHPKGVQGGRGDATHVVTPNTHVIPPQYCCQLNTIRALNTRTAIFMRATAVWQRKMNTSCDNFPISSLITVTGRGLWLLPAAVCGGAPESSLWAWPQHRGMLIPINRSRGRDFPTRDIKPWQSKLGENLSCCDLCCFTVELFFVIQEKFCWWS